MGLINRGLLTCLHTVYKFISQHYENPTKLWRSARRELESMAGPMVVAGCDWKLQWSPLIYQSDASLTGYGFGGSIAHPSQIGACGRILERLRFTRDSSRAARTHALRSDRGFREEVLEEFDILGAVDGLVPKWDKLETPSDLNTTGWGTNESFPEVELSLLSSTQWVLFGMEEFRKLENIMILEARALLSAVVHATFYVPGMRVVFLVDNLGLSLACVRGRAKSNVFASNHFAPHSCSRSGHKYSASFSVDPLGIE